MLFPASVLAVLAFFAGLACAQIRLSGRVVNDNSAPVSGARVTLESPSGRVRFAVSDPGGAFWFTLSTPGEYHISADREGYFRLSPRPVQVSESGGEVQLVLNPVREEFQAVDVHAAAGGLDMDRTTPTRNVSGAELLAIPFPSSNSLKNALRMMPGIVQDAKGNIHLNGGNEDQVLYTLNGFVLNDPISGKFESRLGVEAVQSIDISSGRMPAEFGRGAAGALSITTNPGDDKLRYSATNFIPGIERHKSIYLGSWTPRFNISGPIRKSRAWFSNSSSIQYDRLVIEDLPDGANSSSSWRLANVAQTQVNLTPRQILFAGLLYNGWYAPHTGLSALSPMETSIDRRSRQWFASVKDQIYFDRGSFVEFGYAANRTFGREIPQGHEPLRITPNGSRGNAFADATRRALRDQWLVNWVLPSLEGLGGKHQWKAGIDFNRTSYWQNVFRTSYERYRLDGVLLTRTAFGGRGEFSRSSAEAALYAQDSFRIRPGLLLEFGLRLDWNRLLRHWDVGPRIGGAWSPSHRMNTKISAGFARVYEAANLRVFTRPMDQWSLTTYFAPDGTLVRGPAAAITLPSEHPPLAPRSNIWSAAIEREAARHMTVRASFQRRRSDREFTFVNTLAPGATALSATPATYGATVFDAIYRLGNLRRDVYDAAEFTFRQTFRGEYEWMASYIRSRALSNGVVDINIDDPVVVFNNTGPMPWDAPHRLVAWGRFPLPRKNWAAVFSLECRSGFPFSIVNDASQVIGALNAYRFPMMFEWNQHIERRFVFRGHRWEFRAGFNNITNRKNPNVVNSNQDSPNFMRFYGGQSRALNFRIRWLGKAAR